jgi:hypothetical protein
MPITVESFSTESYFDTLTVNGRRYSGRSQPSGIIPTGDIQWYADFTVQRTGWKLCAEQPSGARSNQWMPLIRSTPSIAPANTPAPPTAAKRFVVRVQMSLRSDGTADDVESSVAPVVASKHGVSEDQVEVSVTATPSDSQQWHVEYALSLESESIATMHLQIAQQLAADADDTAQLLAQSFANKGLLLDATGFTIVAPAEVDGDHSCYNTDVGLKDLFEDGCDTYERNVGFCGQYDDVDFSSQSMCCACGGGAATEPGWTATTEEPILSPESGCVDTDLAKIDRTGDGCPVYGMDPVHFCGEFDDDDFSSMGMCCSCQPYAPPTPAPLPGGLGEAGPTPSPGQVLDGAAPHGLSAVCALVAGSACALGGLVN